MSADGGAALITGVETPLGRALADELARAPDAPRLICAHHPHAAGLPAGSARVRHVAADLTRARDVRNLLFAEASRDVRSVIHVPAYDLERGRGRGRAERGVARAVTAAQLLLTTAEEHPHVERVIVLSSGSVYRIDTRHPMLIDEDHPLELSADAPRSVRERVEVDLVASARAGVSRLRVVVLRCAEILAPGTGGQLIDYLGSRVCLRPLGYDPMINVLSLVDAVQAVRCAHRSPEPGVFNIPGADTLPLSELIHAAGRLGVAVPGIALPPLYGLRALTTGFRFRYDVERRLFHYGGILDGRKAARVLGYTPAHRVDLRALFGRGPARAASG